VKLYADFYASDILVASPLGLRRITGGEGDSEKDRDTGFLSSIELVVVDGVEVFLQQNWRHMLDCFSLLNTQPPTPPPGTDFSRVREWTLAGLGSLYRQTVCLGAWNEPDVGALFRRHCRNSRGCCMLRGGAFTGALVGVVASPLKQTFYRISPVPKFSGSDEARFEYFSRHVLPSWVSAPQRGTLLYVPSYYDYVRIRNLLDAKEMEFVTCCEYSEEKDVARAR